MRPYPGHRQSLLIALLLIVSLLAGPLGPSQSSALVESRMIGQLDVDGPVAYGPEGDSSAPVGLEITLGEGAAQPPTVEVIPPAPAEPLPPEAIQPILDRLPPLTATAAVTVPFRLPVQSLPAPRTGATVTTTFPATETVAPPEPIPTGPLEVLRYAPEGEIQVAPFLNVTFNQPMVPLATLEELSAADVPVRLTPAIPGVWKWIGTRTLTFEYRDPEQGEGMVRFPMATEYQVEVPAGTRSATGGVLEEAVTWTFRTPPPRLRFTHPGYGPQPRHPVIFISFDQRIEPAAVLETIRVTAGGQVYPVHLATQEELQADPAVQRLAERSGEGRWLAFRSDEPFPANTTVVVNIGPGTPSAEGPLVTQQVQSFSFQTYAPLRIDGHFCAYGGDECPPLTPLHIRFNNPLDVERFDPAWISVTPEIPDLAVEAHGNTISLRGLTQGRTTYQVTVAGQLLDIFGQSLGQDQTVTFKTGSAPRFLTGPSEPFVTLDPTTSRPVFTIYSVNYERLRARVYAVQPEDWPAYLKYLSEYYRTDSPPEPPGRQVMSSVFTIHGEPDQLIATDIDLREALGNETGHLIVIVDFPPNPLLGRQTDRSIVQAWVQVTQIGLDAFVNHSTMVAWATALRDGSPLADVQLTLLDAGTQAVTGEDGVATLPLSSTPAPALIARRGDDSAILPQNLYYWSGDGWRQQPLRDELRWYVFDDRQMYRPGEEVHVKGWVRRIEAGQQGDVTLPTGLTGIRYYVYDPRGNDLTDGIADVNDLGGFDLVLTLPANANLGYATIRFEAMGSPGVDGNQFSHTFQIQEFRRPEFSVSARTEGKGPFFVGGEAEVAVSAQYFAGGPLPNAETTWRVTASPGTYAPPNWPDFTFGKWTPWWSYGGPDGGASATQTYTGRTDATGTHYLRMSFEKALEPRPYSVLAEAAVMDVNRQTWAATTSLLVHPADLYVGIRSERTFVEQGEPLEIQAIVTDLDGVPVPDRPIHLRAARLAWKVVKGDWREEEVDVQECTVASGQEPVSCTFETSQGGTYRITATVQDDQGRINQSEFTRWVSGGTRPPARRVEQETVTLIPDKESYQPGDVAQVLVQAPFAPAEGLLTVTRDGILYTERFSMTESTYTLQVPIQEAYLPNVYVNVELVGSAPRTDDAGNVVAELPPRPAYASGTLNLPIPPVSRQLSLTVTPQETELAPGEETTLALTVQDAAGEPVADAELAVVVVDEAVLALTNYQLADPVERFYAQRGSGLYSYYGRANIVLADPAALAAEVAAGAQQAVLERAAMPMTAMPAPSAPTAVAEEAAAMDMAGEAPGEAPTPIQIRTDFNPLATFVPAVRTDEQGQATIPVRLPDNLTRYRVMVVAVAQGRYFGTGEANLTARLPLMVRPSAPRFLNFGDHFQLPVVVQNQTDAPMTVDVVVRALNLALPEGAGRRVEIPANDRREVRFPAATLSAGTVQAQIAAVSGPLADAATVELPVYTPATTEAFATYGVLDEGVVVQPVATPQDVFPQFGGLEVSTSSTALQSLTDALLYLTNYPFECSEQLASRILGVAALRDVLTAFKAEGLPTPEEIEAAVKRDIARLQQLQNPDGGFPIWTKGQESVPFYSIHVTHALQRARLKGYEVPEEMLQRALDHLRRIEDFYPSWYSPDVRRTLSAYALYVRMLMGDVDTAKARQLLNEVPLENQSLEAIAWLWQVLSDDAASTQELAAIRRFVANRAVETPSAANFTTSYGDDGYLLLHSNRRTDALILDALIQDQPDSDLIPKVVNGLLAHRTRGRWGNTQENVFVLLALDRYFNTYESVTPDFVARIWLGDTYVAAHEFRGRTTETQETTIPMDYLVDPARGEGPHDLIIGKEGAGRLYYRLGLRYAPTDLDLEPLEMGFVVQRRYEAVDDPTDVTRDEDGVWHIKAGARVRVRIDLVASNRRYHVALVDPLPAGLEILNPALAVSESIPADPNDRSSYGWWWGGAWYEHQNMRDDRAEAFTTLLWEGVYNYTYVARATTPGEFIVPPARAEEMYSPEVFGRSGSDRVIVE
ncbi:MAG: hypothetical protein KatS3mg050_0775 [Litorilinea sp.]|nr:MAG: hypothetical protein KatS3mg050_0775 [Litorilinea sp.]